MISLAITLQLLLGWATEQMLYEQQQNKLQNNLPSPEEEQRKLPLPSKDSSLLQQEAPAAEQSFQNEGTIKTNEANQQGLYWLGLNDQGQYNACWLAAAPLLKDVIAQEQWTAAMKATRAGYGTVRSRKLASTTPVKQLPNGTKGNFTRLIYRTQFSKGNANEILILTNLGPIAKWKVVSYQIQK